MAVAETRIPLWSVNLVNTFLLNALVWRIAAILSELGTSLEAVLSVLAPRQKVKNLFLVHSVAVLLFQRGCIIPLTPGTSMTHLYVTFVTVCHS
jgi:hypothetical protein